MCVCVCVRACVRACALVYVRVYVARFADVAMLMAGKRGRVNVEKAQRLSSRYLAA